MQSHEETTFQTLCDNRERGMLSIFIFQNHPQNATHARNPSLCDPPKLLQVLLTSPVSVFGHCRASIQSFYGANILDPTGNLGTHYETRLRSINQIEFGNLKVISFLGGHYIRGILNLCPLPMDISSTCKTPTFRKIISSQGHYICL